MNAQYFIHSWSALWLWMQFLNEELNQAEVCRAYTYRKGRLDVEFTKAGNDFLLSWEKQGNQILLTTTHSPSLPRKRVAVLKKVPVGSRVISVQVHSKDRLLKIVLDNGDELIWGTYPQAGNIYHLSEGRFRDSFLKAPQAHDWDKAWLSVNDPLPRVIPGAPIESDDLRAGVQGLSLDSEQEIIHFGMTNESASLNISQLVLEVLKQAKKKKETTTVSIQKIARTVLKRWKSKNIKIQSELLEAESYPELETELQALKIALGMNMKRQAGQLVIPAELSPTRQDISLTLKAGTTLNQAIQAKAKKIRKFKGKLTQLTRILDEIAEDIEQLEQLMMANDTKELQQFLEARGEALDRRGRQQTERKPYKKFRSPGGFDILVGRTSQDNDTLTFKVANKNDWWFHARLVRGSHVILRTGNQSPAQNDILAAARYAAVNSKAKHSGIVVVQYCQRKHLTKPKGAHPGAVLVHQEQSVTVSLD